MDYLDLLKPLPNECRDTVTGNAFFHGCVDEITWYLEGRSGWIAGITLGSCMLNVRLIDDLYLLVLWFFMILHRPNRKMIDSKCHFYR